jgi:hypothetical protein
MSVSTHFKDPEETVDTSCGCPENNLGIFCDIRITLDVRIKKTALVDPERNTATQGKAFFVSMSGERQNEKKGEKELHLKSLPEIRATLALMPLSNKTLYGHLPFVWPNF